MFVILKEKVTACLCFNFQDLIFIVCGGKEEDLKRDSEEGWKSINIRILINGIKR